jgi:hypothetical protein
MYMTSFIALARQHLADSTIGLETARQFIAEGPSFTQRS